MEVEPVTQVRFILNRGRVERLLKLSTCLDDSDAAEVLRAAVVLLHASLEDFLRSVAEQYWPFRDSTELDRVPLPGEDTVRKTSARVLRRYGERTARDLLQEAVRAYLATYTVSDVKAVGRLLADLGVTDLSENVDMKQIEMLILRRHQIVHRADRVEGGDNETFEQAAVEHAAVHTWAECVAKLVDHVGARLGAPGAV